MGKINAAITGIAAYIPDYVLTNDELSHKVETSDEWIMQRVGIKERRILKGDGLATSDMGAGAVIKLLEKTATKPEEIELIIVATITPDMLFPSTACIIAEKVGIKDAWGFDLSAACSGFIYALQTAAQFIETGRYKKIIVVAGDKMSSVMDYTDRNTCILFGDAATAILLEPTNEGFGVIDFVSKLDGSGRDLLYQRGGGSLRPATHESVDLGEHFLRQDGKGVFKVAVSRMSEISIEIMEKHKLNNEDIDWFVPHQANIRIIDAVACRLGLSREKIMINIERYGNTTAATIPLCLWEKEKELKKGDKIILTAFGGGFTWGSIYLKWAYNS